MTRDEIFVAIVKERGRQAAKWSGDHVMNGRRGIGIELKASYYRQAVRNVAEAMKPRNSGPQGDLLEVVSENGADS